MSERRTMELATLGGKVDQREGGGEDRGTKGISRTKMSLGGKVQCNK